MDEDDVAFRLSHTCASSTREKRNEEEWRGGGRGEGKSRKCVHEAWMRNKMLCSVSRGVGETGGKIERAF